MSVRARNISIRSHFGDDKSSLALGTLYFALYNGDPVGSGVEPTATGGYARKAVTNDSTLWGTISSAATSVTNAIDIVFATATGAYSEANLDHWAIHDNAAGGIPVYSGSLTASVVVTGVGDIPRILAGALTLTQQ